MYATGARRAAVQSAAIDVTFMRLATIFGICVGAVLGTGGCAQSDDAPGGSQGADGGQGGGGTSGGGASGRGSGGTGGLGGAGGAAGGAGPGAGGSRDGGLDVAGSGSDAGGGGSGGGGASGTGGASGGGSGADAGAAADQMPWTGGGKVCGETTTPIGYSPRTPDVLVAFDHSGSMRMEFGGGGGTRLSVEQAILRDLVMRFQDRIRWGYEEFPINVLFMDCRPGGIKGCCAAPVAVAPDFMNYAAINKAMAPCGMPGPKQCGDIREGTPTADGLRVCREFYAGFKDGIQERYVLLSTDGEPTCGIAGSGSASPCDGAEAQVKMLAAQGVKTIVLGVSDEVSASPCLNRLAVAGGAPRPGGPPHFYPGSDPALLRQYLEEIVRGIAKPSCFIDLDNPPPDPTKVAVFFDMAQVPRDEMRKNGWDFVPGGARPMTKIQIFGSYCTMLEGFEVKDINVRYGCPPCGGTVSCD